VAHARGDETETPRFDRPRFGLDLEPAFRLGAVGGALDVDSAPGRGTRVTGVVPLATAAR